MKILAVVGIFAVIIMATDATNCPDGWQIFSPEFCVRYIPEMKTKAQAEIYCQTLEPTLGSDLIPLLSSVGTAIMYGAVVNANAEVQNVWISFSKDLAAEYLKSYPCDALKWCDNQPDNPAHKCVRIRMHYTGATIGCMDDVDCDSVGEFVCIAFWSNIYPSQLEHPQQSPIFL